MHESSGGHELSQASIASGDCEAAAMLRGDMQPVMLANKNLQSPFGGQHLLLQASMIASRPDPQHMAAQLRHGCWLCGSIAVQ